MTFDTTYASKPCGAILMAGKYPISALAFFALSFFGTGLNAATWTVKHLTGDEDSGVSSALTLHLRGQRPRNGGQSCQRRDLQG